MQLMTLQKNNNMIREGVGGGVDLEQIIRKGDEETIKDVKDDMDTLLVFVRVHSSIHLTLLLIS